MTALQRTEKIKAVFLETQLFCAKHGSMPAVEQYLAQAEKEFCSIAYESASMAIALKDIKANTFPNEWLLFANGPAAAHKAQVYVGLGWAIAKLNLPFSTAVKKLDPEFYCRIADGCGYYDASFRYHQAINDKQQPGYLPGDALPAYYQGIGRSTWYSQRTAIEKVYAVIKSFPAKRRADLWRGLGIAVAYVGGCSDEDLKALFDNAASNAAQLAAGAELVVRSRTMANTMTADTEHCLRLWHSLIAESKKKKNIVLTA